MKHSLYNNIVKITDNTSLLYNAGKDCFILVKDSVCLKSDPNQLFSKNHSLYEEFIKNGIIIDNDVDEFKQQLRLYHDSLLNSTNFSLIINPTLDCNLHCWYCYENHIKSSRIAENTLTGILKMIDKVFEKQSELQTFSLSFFGGEPLLDIDTVKTIIDYTSQCCQKRNVSLHVSFTSNGVLLNSESIQYFTKQHLDVGFQITLDGGKEYHDKTRFSKGKIGTYDIILRNIQSLAENQISVVLRINYTAENFSSIPSILNDIKNWDDTIKAYIKVDLQRVWQDNEGEIEEAPLMEQFRNNGFVISSPLLDMDNLRQPCYADYANELLVNYNGDIFKCTARDFSSENRLGYLTDEGNIVWTSLTPEERIQQILPKKICSTCSIFPLCGGGCLQKRSEIQDENTCMYHITEGQKKEIILNRFYHHIVKKQVTEHTNPQ